MKPSICLTFLIVLSSFLHAQPCTPNNDTIPGIEPDTLNIAYVGIPYNEALYYYMPEDTFVYFGTFLVHLYIDSLTIDSVKGLPQGFSYACNNSWCSVPGGGNGCAAITGTAVTVDTGIHPILVFVTVAVSDTFGTPVAQVPDTVTSYFIDVQMPNGISTITNDKDLWVGDPFPNPAIGEELYLPVYSSRSQELQLQCYDLSGRLIVNLQNKIYPEWQNVKLETSLPSGSYMIELKTKSDRILKKIIVD